MASWYGGSNPAERQGFRSALSYEDIKRRCWETRAFFEDQDFPAVNKSIYYSKSLPTRLVWKRPHEICKRPQWITDGATRFDVDQGQLGDCWLLAAVASLTCNSSMLYKVVPPDQSFDSGQYCGAFRFNLWHRGEWQEVVVDDRLPTNLQGELVFMHSTEKCEFWSALLEKAYAKLMGSYESLEGGDSLVAMEVFTGGVGETFHLRHQTPPDLFLIMYKAHERNSLMGCSINDTPLSYQVRSKGLIAGHAYSITSVQVIEMKTSGIVNRIPLVRVRNPWGNECEWKGAWGDESPEWRLISERERQRLGLVVQHDGEFWMSFKDFTENFDTLEICNLGPDSLRREDLPRVKHWGMPHKKLGQWKSRVNAGGSQQFKISFHTNPQFRVTLTRPDGRDQSGLSTVIVALMQKGNELHDIGYSVYKVDNPQDGQLGQNYLSCRLPLARSPNGFTKRRQVCGRHKLPLGTYAIIPSTFVPGCECEFLLRVFSE